MKDNERKLLEVLKKNPWMTGGMDTGKINADEITYMKYLQENSSLYERIKGLPSTAEMTETFYYPDGRIIHHQIIKNFEKVNRKTEKQYPPEKLQKMFKEIADLLSDKHLVLSFFYDDSYGQLTIYFKDGHKEDYDRGMGFDKDNLRNHILEVDL